MIEGPAGGRPQTVEWVGLVVGLALEEHLRAASSLAFRDYLCEWLLRTFGSRAMAEVFLKDILASSRDPPSARGQLVLALIRARQEDQDDTLLLNALTGLSFRRGSKTEQTLDALLSSPAAVAAVVRAARGLNDRGALLPAVTEPIPLCEAKDVLEAAGESTEAGEVVEALGTEESGVARDVLLRAVAVVANRRTLRRLEQLATTLRVDRLGARSELFFQEFQKKLKTHFPEKSTEWVVPAFREVDAQCARSSVFSSHDVVLAIAPCLFSAAEVA